MVICCDGGGQNGQAVCTSRRREMSWLGLRVALALGAGMKRLGSWTTAGLMCVGRDGGDVVLLVCLLGRGDHQNFINGKFHKYQMDGLEASMVATLLASAGETDWDLAGRQ